MRAAPPSPPGPPGGGAIVDLVKERIRLLAVADFVRERVAARIKSDGAPGMDERKVWNDWISDVLADRDRGTFETARRDPAKAYEGYAAERVADPFRVNYRAVNALARQAGDYEANTFVHVRWPQEIAWARRLRIAGDERTSVLSQSFLMIAARDPGKTFTEVAQAWESALDDLRFSTAEEHNLSEGAIRSGEGSPAFRPAFLRLFEIRHAELLDRMNEGGLSAAAAKARVAEETDMRASLSRASVAVARRSPMCRLTTVIDVARGTGRDSDELVEAEAQFLAEVLRGKLPNVVQGLPYKEFVNWLRATPRGPAPEPVAPGDEAHRAFVSLANSPVSWIRDLPEAYRGLGAANVDSFREWSTPLLAKGARIPRDAVCDYGFFLAKRNYRN